MEILSWDQVIIVGLVLAQMAQKVGVSLPAAVIRILLLYKLCASVTWGTQVNTKGIKRLAPVDLALQ